MNKQRIVRVAAIMAVAGVTGFVMQSQDKGQSAGSQGPRIAAAVDPAAPAFAGAAALPLPRPVLPDPGQTAELSPPVTEPAPVVAEPAAQVVVTDPAPQVAEAEPACSDDMVLIAQPGAMIDLGLLAACRPDQRITIRHGGLVVTGQTSAAGTLIASIPALSDPAEITLAFADGTQVSQAIAVPDLARFERFGVQWMEGDAFQLHAFIRQSGAEVFGDSAARPTVEGGFLSQLGDSTTQRPLLAEVYTYPAGVRALSDEVDLTIESAVTTATCGREILGETIQLSAGHITLRDLVIEMPGCEAVGEYVVLPNPVAPEKLASN